MGGDGLLAEGVGEEMGGCRPALKSRQCPAGQTGKSLLRSPGQSWFSLPDAAMIVYGDVCWGTWERVGPGLR